MRMNLVTLVAVTLMPLLAGCDQLRNVAPSQQQAVVPRGGYAIISTSADGTFLLDSEAGKVWRYSAKDDAFLEVVVTSKILRYERGPDGKMHVVDPKNDPVGIH